MSATVGPATASPVQNGNPGQDKHHADLFAALRGLRTRHKTPILLNPEQATHPWRRFVALGDSFTEGLGDPESRTPGGLRGWADRVAEELSSGQPDFAYANLAIRGKLLHQILDEQLEPAVELKPDLVSLSAGGNDLIFRNGDPDGLAERLDSAVATLHSAGATVVLFTGPDWGATPVFGLMRGKVAIFNEHLRVMAERYHCRIADLWAMSELHDPAMWDADRLHFSPLGHHTIAAMVLETLDVPHTLQPYDPRPLPLRNWREARMDDLVWAREYLAPWVIKRLLHQSENYRSAKRPNAGPVLAPTPTLRPPLGLAG
jgi:lysophospholipase L1-like esterase